jgi:GntR family transcriptional regulator
LDRRFNVTGTPYAIREARHGLVNPNTAHKVVAALVSEGVLVTTPAVGSVVAEREAGGRKERSELLGAELEKLVVEAKKLGLGIEDVQAALSAHWKKLGGK